MSHGIRGHDGRAASLLTRDHQSREPQPRKVLTDRGPRRIARLGECRHVRLPLAQPAQQQETRAIGKETQHFHGDRQSLAVI